MLCEVHTGVELSRVLALSEAPDAIGVNNRDLHTFEVRLETSLELVSRIPLSVVRVAESGIGSVLGPCPPARRRLRRPPYRRKPHAPGRSRRGTAGSAQPARPDASRTNVYDGTVTAMSLWIKICGNTTLADAQMATDSGADALGFIFAPSPRRVTPDQVAAITPHLSPSVEKIGVFVDASFAEIAAVVKQCGLTGVQLHTGVESAQPAQLRARFGSRLRVLEVIHFGDQAAGMLKSVSSDPNVDGILIDSRTATGARRHRHRL